MVYLELFLSFVRIGFTSFGGMSMIPLILEEMQTHGWMTAEDMTNLVAIAEMTPGPLGINSATFAGTQAAGVLGGLAAVLGVLMPAFTLTLAGAVCFEKFRKSAIMQAIMEWIKPICIAMILQVILTLSLENYTAEGQIQPGAVAIGLVVLYLLQKKKWSIPRVITGAAVMGIICYGILSF